MSAAQIAAFCAGAEWANGKPFPAPEYVKQEATRRYGGRPTSPSQCVCTGDFHVNDCPECPDWAEPEVPNAE